MLQGEVGRELRGLIREVCRSHEIEIMKGHIRPDHEHLLLSVPPQIAPSPRDAGDQRQDVASSAARLSAAAPVVLGSTPVGTGVFRSQRGGGDR